MNGPTLREKNPVSHGWHEGAEPRRITTPKSAVGLVWTNRNSFHVHPAKDTTDIRNFLGFGQSQGLLTKSSSTAVVKGLDRLIIASPFPSLSPNWTNLSNSATAFTHGLEDRTRETESWSGTTCTGVNSGSNTWRPTWGPVKEFIGPKKNPRQRRNPGGGTHCWSCETTREKTPSVREALRQTTRTTKTKEKQVWRRPHRVRDQSRCDPLLRRRIVFVSDEKWEQTPKGRVVPEGSVVEVVQTVHEELGHVGTMPTRKELEKQQLWIPGSRVRQILKDCNVCGRYNAGQRGRRGDGLTIKSTVPWGSVCMDAAGPLGITGKKGEKYLLVLVDSMSGYVLIRPVRRINGSSVVSMLDQVCSTLVVPKELRTDNGAHFLNAQVNWRCQEKAVPGLRVPFKVGQRVWIKARDHLTNAAVKAKYKVSDIVEKILDSNTVLLKKEGIQGIEQLKPIPS
ncbi:hypothetical protein D9C73_028202 [Collichthys lucidus]|uniref:Integrase catalytic domain-containing protein n=1 Tax=Collichthys lucidus TaxID=240159 RepID=A0A4U5TVE9_COLLU|nr:hypothetical protein D9C73_028202 [Collichthys lucidus]